MKQKITEIKLVELTCEVTGAVAKLTFQDGVVTQAEGLTFEMLQRMLAWQEEPAAKKPIEQPKPQNKPETPQSLTDFFKGHTSGEKTQTTNRQNGSPAKPAEKPQEKKRKAEPVQARDAHEELMQAAFGPEVQVPEPRITQAALPAEPEFSEEIVSAVKPSPSKVREDYVPEKLVPATAEKASVPKGHYPPLPESHDFVSLAEHMVTCGVSTVEEYLAWRDWVFEQDSDPAVRDGVSCAELPPRETFVALLESVGYELRKGVAVKKGALHAAS